ncbi:terpenoidsynthase [Moniliophthora roreri MCA 2997]|uniref:(2E,6E)-farnesyl diphosphate synthase n=1 Tax=Moniliophthora roreri (strain MCA 2997) TaxID=1381753 RepID=V2WWU1_MONRO|nr:terpenoidsynthase [Moniliophthora roreri MCA 2997]KAI3609028.1 terpenoidsynthase [Moniliophthora roreri]
MSSLYDNILNKLSNNIPWSTRNETAILEPFTFITGNPGKDMRGRLIEAFNRWLNVPEDKLVVIAKIVNMLHASSLMVDDVEDDSQLRRGRPVVHKIYGVAQTINSANYVYFLAFQELANLKASTPDKDLNAIVTEELISLHRGQGLEILWRDSLQCPSEEDYVEMVNNKTGGLLRIGIKLMMACATTNTSIDYAPLVNLIGVYFQIRDDLMNLQSPEYESNKGFAEDLTEGKFSFPIVHSIHADRTNTQVLNILQKRPSTPTLKHHTIHYLKNRTRSFEYTLDVLDKLDKQTRDEIQRLGGNEGLDKLMDSLWVDRAKLMGS